ncbi:MAG: LysE family translocator [Gammaproteobacteria bacterium]|nr:LysE family translocator [Gammaproteobacteria bacterium]
MISGEHILQAIGLGIVLIFMIGPVFFSLIQVAMNKGLFMGLMMSLGVAISDIAYILLAYYGISDFFVQHLKEFKIVGGGIFIIMGVYNLVGKKTKAALHIPLENQFIWIDYWKVFGKGFVVNMASPFVVIFWIVSVGAINSELNGDMMSVFYFFSIVILTVISGDIIKTLLARRLSRMITPRVILWISRVVGVVFILAGIRIFYMKGI